MIIKGKARTNGSQLGKYLTADAKKINERVNVLEVKGSTSKDARKALLEMSLASELTKRGRDGLYHASISPDKDQDQQMRLDEWFKCVEALEEELGLKGQNRVVVLHEKRGLNDNELRQHIHVVWQREKDGKLISDAHNYKAHDRARARIENELQHAKTHQPQDLKKDLHQVWNESNTGAEFIAKAKEKGYTIGRDYTTAQGGIRPYCVVDRDGRSSDLVRQLPKEAKTEQVRERLKDIEASLPTEKDLAGRQSTKHRENEKNRRDNTIPDGQKPAANENHEKEKVQESTQKETQQSTSNEQSSNQERFKQKAKAAGENFADVITPEELTPEEEAILDIEDDFAKNLASFRKKEQDFYNTARMAQQNKFDTLKDNREEPQESEFEERIRLARERLERDDFDQSHEIK